VADLSPLIPSGGEKNPLVIILSRSVAVGAVSALATASEPALQERLERVDNPGRVGFRVPPFMRSRSCAVIPRAWALMARVRERRACTTDYSLGNAAQKGLPVTPRRKPTSLMKPQVVAANR
jgi:hypothetical protein